MRIIGCRAASCGVPCFWKLPCDLQRSLRDLGRTYMFSIGNKAT